MISYRENSKLSWLGSQFKLKHALAILVSITTTPAHVLELDFSGSPGAAAVGGGRNGSREGAYEQSRQLMVPTREEVKANISEYRILE